MEIIKEIKEIKDSDIYRTGYDGYEVITNKQTIKINISNGQSCCEQWGYLIISDNELEFIGSELLSIELVDVALNVKKWEEEEYSADEGGHIFINLNTTKGTLQFAVYNGHNGYYGHNVAITSNSFNYNDIL